MKTRRNLSTIFALVAPVGLAAPAPFRFPAVNYVSNILERFNHYKQFVVT